MKRAESEEGGNKREGDTEEGVKNNNIDGEWRGRRKSICKGF